MNDTVEPDNNDNDKDKKPDDMTKPTLLPLTAQAEALLRPSKEPTSDEMRLFASLYTAKDWEICCKSSEFCLAVTQDLRRARVMAGKMLKS
jgi:hypothetical protein